MGETITTSGRIGDALTCAFRSAACLHLQAEPTQTTQPSSFCRLLRDSSNFLCWSRNKPVTLTPAPLDVHRNIFRFCTPLRLPRRQHCESPTDIAKYPQEFSLLLRKIQTGFSNLQARRLQKASVLASGECWVGGGPGRASQDGRSAQRTARYLGPPCSGHMNRMLERGESSP